MKEFDSRDVCSYKHASALDSSWRRKLQNPSKFLKPYIKPGMTVLDFGCGTGFCTFDIAGLLGGIGKIIAADLQQEMLDLLQKKVSASPYNEIITLHKCAEQQTGLTEHFDFILLFYVFHEVPDPKRLLNELKPLLNPGGKIMISEPLFHVSQKSYSEEMALAKECEYNVEKGPNIFFSRTMILE